MEEVKFGQYALPVLLTVILGLIYKFIGINIPDKWKSVVAVGAGIGLGILGIAYNGLPWTVVNITDHVIYGFMMGASAVGIYEVTRGVPLPGSPANPR